MANMARMASMASIICAILGDHITVVSLYLEPWIAGVNAVYASLQKVRKGQAILNLGSFVSFHSLSPML